MQGSFATLRHVKQRYTEREMRTLTTAGVIVGIPLIVGVLPLVVIGTFLQFILG